jgi:hypothetical protein
MKSLVRILAAPMFVTLICCLISSAATVLSAASARGEEASAAKPSVQEVSGIDFGGKTPMVFVARDKAAWEMVVQATGERRMLPIGFAAGQDLTSLGNIDFGKKMIVAVFWGEMSFSGQGEKCRIERVTAGTDEVVVDCAATLWGGAVKRAYRAWPYHALVVERSDLPVRFRQTTEWKADPKRSEKEKTLAVVAAKEWKKEVGSGK